MRRRNAAIAGAIACAIATLLALSSTSPAEAQSAPPAPSANSAPGYPGVDIFAMPAAAQAEDRVRSLIRTGRYAAAQEQLDVLTRAYPDVPAWLALGAVVAAGQGDDRTALDRLERATRLGFTDLFGLLTRPPLNRLAGHPRVGALSAVAAPKPETPPPPRARRVRNGEASVDAGNVAWDGETQSLNVFFHFPRGLRRLPLYVKPQDGPLAELAALVGRGQAAGNVGDLYDNRDDGHSRLLRDPERPAQLTHVAYEEGPRARRLHYGLNTAFVFDAITFGNSSTALGGPNWRSQTRMALTSPGGAERLWRLYAHNHLYVFPAVHDFFSEKSGWRGDVFPAYTPYVIASVGKSGTDRPFLEAIRAILAAFTPKTKAALKDRRLITPTVQQILRRTFRGAEGRNGYLSASAHPTAFDGRKINLAAAIKAANAMRPEDIPPMTTIQVLEEPQLRSGVSFFADGMGERLFDTPAALARVWRGVEGTRRYLLRAAAEDPNGRAVKFHWRVLRGAPDGVRIKPGSADGALAEVRLKWQSRQPDLVDPDILSHRVDIAVFADNGVHISAPAIFSMAFPSHQTRAYEQGARGPRIKSVNYVKGPSRYADPAIWPLKNWTDVYSYDASGDLTGWVRVDTKGKRSIFRADGRLQDGRRVAYPMKRDPKGGRPMHLFVKPVVVK